MEKKQVDPAGFTGITELRDDFYDCVEQRKKFLEKKELFSLDWIVLDRRTELVIKRCWHSEGNKCGKWTI